MPILINAMEHKELINECELISHLLPDGTRHGLVTISKNGELLYSVDYFYGIPNGKGFGSFTSNKKLYINGIIGEIYGKSKRYWNNPNLTPINGSVCEYNSEKQVNYKAHYVDGIKHGMYYNDSVTGEYVNGKKHGRFYHTYNEVSVIIDYNHNSEINYYCRVGKYCLIMSEFRYITARLKTDDNMSAIITCSDDLITTLKLFMGEQYEESIIDKLLSYYMQGPMSHRSLFFGGGCQNGYRYTWIKNGTIRVKEYYRNNVLLEKSMTFPNGDTQISIPSLIERRRIDGSIIMRWVISNFELEGIKSVWDTNGRLISRYYCINGRPRALM